MNLMLPSQLLSLIVLYLTALYPGPARCGKSDPPQATLRSDCKDHSYQTHLISEDPLVIYIDGFISQEEALQLNSLR